MNGDLYKRIMLTGKLSGSVRVRAEKNGGSVLDLSLNGLSDGMNVYTVSADSVIKTEYSGKSLASPQTGIFAVAVEKDGRLVSAGFSGGTRAEKSRILDELRIRAAGEYAGKEPREVKTGSEKAAPPADKPAPARTEPAQTAPAQTVPAQTVPARTEPARAESAAAVPRANADVTEMILKQAERLFAALGTAEKEEPEPSPIRNPFPKTFPNSEWRRLPGDERLYGTANVNGRKVRLVALPAEARQNNSRSGRARAVLSADGKRYFIVRQEG